jgi:hypothetical protein
MSEIEIMEVSALSKEEIEVLKHSINDDSSSK